MPFCRSRNPLQLTTREHIQMGMVIYHTTTNRPQHALVDEGREHHRSKMCSSGGIDFHFDGREEQKHQSRRLKNERDAGPLRRCEAAWHCCELSAARFVIGKERDEKMRRKIEEGEGRIRMLGYQHGAFFSGAKSPYRMLAHLRGYEISTALTAEPCLC